MPKLSGPKLLAKIIDKKIFIVALKNLSNISQDKLILKLVLLNILSNFYFRVIFNFI